MPTEAGAPNPPPPPLQRRCLRQQWEQQCHKQAIRSLQVCEFADRSGLLRLPIF